MQCDAIHEHAFECEVECDRQCDMQCDAMRHVNANVIGNANVIMQDAIRSGVVPRSISTNIRIKTTKIDQRTNPLFLMLVFLFFPGMARF